MSILDLLGNLGGKKAGSGLRHFTESITLAQFTTTADTKTLYAGQENDIATLKIPAQQYRSFGIGGVTAGGADLRGIFYASLFNTATTPVQIEGSLRLVNRNNAGDRSVVYVNPRTESLRGSKTDRNNSYLLGVNSLKAKQDSYLVMTIEPDVDMIFSKANSDVLLPLTVYHQ